MSARSPAESFARLRRDGVRIESSMHCGATTSGSRICSQNVFSSPTAHSLAAFGTMTSLRMMTTSTCASSRTGLIPSPPRRSLDGSWIPCRGKEKEFQWPGTAHFHWRTLDVFTAWFEDGGFYMYNAGGELGRDRVLPLRTWKFKGHEVLVPNDPEAVLELIYGPNWRTPDPMFQWRVPRGVQDKLNGFSERLSMRREGTSHRVVTPELTTQ